MTKLKISVIISSYNPIESSINATIDGLIKQTLPLNEWELIVIDNNSGNGVLNRLDLAWHINSKLIAEPKQGLTYSRIAGVNNSVGEIIVMVDDDNVLHSNYLHEVLKHFDANPKLGTAGGKIEGLFDHTPAEWTKQFWGMLAIRDFGDKPRVSEPKLLSEYPGFAPVGAGMTIRKKLFTSYVAELTDNTTVITDRSGSSLSSGGDNEINISVLKQGYFVAYYPDLILKHIIPASRLTKQYLARLNYESSKSWVKLLLKYQICPWPTIPATTSGLRKAKAWIKYKAWSNEANYINWRGACGKFEALKNE